MKSLRPRLSTQAVLVGLTAFIWSGIAPAQTDSPFCKPGYTVGFFNGVFNNRDDAFGGLDRLRNVAGTTWKGQPVDYQLFYNQSGKNPARAEATLFEDLAEVMRQKDTELNGLLKGRWELFWQTLRGGGLDWATMRAALSSTEPLLESLVSILVNKIGAGYAWWLSNPPTSADMAAHAAQLGTAISNGQKVLLVAHSQGNLFVNAAYDAMLPRTNAQAMRVVHVAPATAIQRGPYTTANIDVIIAMVLRAGTAGGVLPPNWVLPPGHLLVDKSGHTFLGTYMNASLTAAGKIEDEIRSAMNALEDPPLDGTRYSQYLAAVNFLAPKGSLAEPQGLALEPNSNNWVFIDGLWNMTQAQRAKAFAYHAQGYYWTSAIAGQGANGFWLDSLGTDRWCGKKTLRAWGDSADEWAYRAWNPVVYGSSYAAVINNDADRAKLGSPTNAAATVGGYVGFSSRQVVQEVGFYATGGSYIRFVAQPESAIHEGVEYVPLTPDHYRGRMLMSIVVDKKL